MFMNINTKFVFLLLVFAGLMSCAESIIKKDIAKAYLSLGENYDEEIIVNKINILEHHQMTFKSLANEEAFRLKTVNDLILEQMQITDSIQLVVQNVIESRSCLIKNADEDQKVKLNKLLREDSILLEESNRKGQILKLKELDNRVKIINILNLAESEGMAKTKNYYVLHEIDLVLGDKSIKDTTMFISLGNEQFNYLKKNIVIDNK